MKTTSIDNFIEEIEYLLRNSNLEKALERYCDYFGVNGQYANQRQIAESNLTRLRNYEISKRSGIEQKDTVLNNIVSACWSILTDLKKASNYQHKEPFYSKVIPRKGKIQHNIPAEMRVNDTEPCKVRVVVSKNVEISASPTYDLPNTTEAPVQILGEEGEVEICSVEAETFQIQLIPDLPTQHFLPKISTEWTFYVTPKTTGNHLLALNLVSNIRDNNGALAHQQVVYSIAKEISVVDQAIVQKPRTMVTEGRGYVWTVPILRYLWMWTLVFLSYFWVPTLLIGTWGGLMIHKAITEKKEVGEQKKTTSPAKFVEVVVYPDKKLNTPFVSHQGRHYAVQPLENGAYKISIEQEMQKKGGLLMISDHRYTCFGRRQPKDNRVDCKCVEPRFKFKIDIDSLHITDEVVQIVIDQDSLFKIQGHRIGDNLYEANYYMENNKINHTFKIETYNYQCFTEWNPSNDPNIVYFNNCKKWMDPGTYITQNIKFSMDKDVTNRVLVKPQSGVVVFLEDLRLYQFSYDHVPGIDSIEVVVTGTSDDRPCTCVGKKMLRRASNLELIVEGKCTFDDADPEQKTCIVSAKLAFDVTNPTVTLYRTGQIQKPIWSKNLKSKGREIVLPPIPQGKGEINLRIVGQDKSIHTAVFTPNKNTITVKTSTNNVAINLKLGTFFRQNLTNEQLQIVDAVTRKLIGDIDVNSGNITIYPVKGKNLDVIWKTKGDGGNIATITVAKITVSNKGGTQDVTCTPSSDLLKVVDLRQKTQKKSTKSTEAKVIFPIKN